MNRLLASWALLLAVALLSNHAQADEPFVPGTGEKVAQSGDDFEDARWSYVKNGRKASYEDDEQQRPPGGKSRNGRWYESALRGQPDVVKRVPTPPGGLEGSKGALLLATKYSGIPGTLAGKQMQDDFEALRTAAPMNLRRRTRDKLPQPAVQDAERMQGIWLSLLGKHDGPYLFNDWSIADAFVTPYASRFVSYGIARSSRADTYISELMSDEDFLEWEIAGLSEPWEIAEADQLYR